MEKLNAAIERLEEFKYRHGRYTLEEAATFIHEQTGEPFEGMKSQLIAAVKDGELQTYSPESFTKNYSEVIRDFYDHVYWYELNDWLKKNKPNIDCEFPDPTFPDRKFYTDEANRNGGRYQLGLAAMFIASRANAEVNSMMRKLFEAAGAGELIVYERGMDEVYRFNPNRKSDTQFKDSECFLEAKWHDLNAWLKIKEPGIFETYQFTKPDAPAAMVATLPVTNPSGDEIPGKMPQTKIGKLAIKAAWQIECGTSKRATAKQVIEKLQAWTDTEPELADTIPHGVKWTTTKGKQKPFDIEACAKALETWQASRA